MVQPLIRRLRTAALMVGALLILSAGCVLVSGQAAVVITHGVSMNPLYYQGDVVVVAKASSYSVGEIAAYNLPGRDEVALHRIIGGDATGFVFKGDNNESIDPIKPQAHDLVGRAIVHIPQGGLWLQDLTSPPVLALLAFTLLAGGSAAATTRGRKRRRTAVSRHISSRPSPTLSLGALPSSLRISGALCALFAVLGAVLGALAWSGPLETASTSQVKSGTRMDFSYAAAVGNSPAYDGTTANSPDPVFRKLTDTVDVHFSYHGDPGTVAVNAVLSTQGGWHTSTPLAGPQTFTGPGYDGKVTLDLKALEAKAQAAAAITGLPATPLSIVITPQVTTAAGANFGPGLKLTLTPLQLALAGSPDTLSVTDAATTEQTAMTPRMLGVNGLGITAATARLISAVLFAAALVIGVIVVVFARRTAPADEAAAIRRRYASLLVRVHPMPAAQGRPVIDVTAFSTLAKLAERYGLLVLHWSRSGVETFIVQDENITYRYRAGTDQAPTAAQSLGADPANLHHDRTH